jgi:hypothetical protein
LGFGSGHVRDFLLEIEMARGKGGGLRNTRKTVAVSSARRKLASSFFLLAARSRALCAFARAWLKIAPGGAETNCGVGYVGVEVIWDEWVGLWKYIFLSV